MSTKTPVWIGPVLAATDFSDAAAEALRQASQIAVRRQAPLALCHVSSERGTAAPGGFLKRRAGEPSWRFEQRIYAALDAWSSNVLGLEQLRVRDFIVEYGAPARGICAVAERLRADLIAIGGCATGRDAVDLGAVARAVVREGRCEVLVARASRAGRVLAALRDPVDSASSSLIVALAEEQALQRATGIVLLQPGDVASLAPGPDDGRIGPVLTAARMLPADLIVLGREAPGATGSLNLFAEALLQNTDCSVLLARGAAAHGKPPC